MKEKSLKSVLEKVKNNQPKRFFPDYKSTFLRSPKKKLLEYIPTNTEMTGPLFNENIINQNSNDLTINFSQKGEKAIGQEIIKSTSVFPVIATLLLVAVMLTPVAPV